MVGIRSDVDLSLKISQKILRLMIYSDSVSDARNVASHSRLRPPMKRADALVMP